MTVLTVSESNTISCRSGAWGAVFAMTLCVSALIASEFMPVSLLTPLASDLHLTAGQAGQAISVSGIFAVVMSLLVSRATRGIDRGPVVPAFRLRMSAAGTSVAFALNLAVLMGGRALLGFCFGVFWSMKTATVMRLVSKESVPRALAVLNGGNALATTVAAPLGSFLGSYVGWRGAFFCVLPLPAVTSGWHLLSFPSIPRTIARSSAKRFTVLRC